MLIERGATGTTTIIGAQVVPEAMFVLLMALGGYDIDCLTTAAVAGTPTMSPGGT